MLALAIQPAAACVLSCGIYIILVELALVSSISRLTLLAWANNFLQSTAVLMSFSLDKLLMLKLLSADCSEMSPLEVRPAASSFNVAINLLFTIVIGYCLVPMLCGMKWGIFLFFAGATFCILHELLMSHVTLTGDGAHPLIFICSASHRRCLMLQNGQTCNADVLLVLSTK